MFTDNLYQGEVNRKVIMDQGISFIHERVTGNKRKRVYSLPLKT